jgi:type II secretory pathway component PulF
MKTYKYIARDLSGIKKQGIWQANSSNDVLTYLREQACIPVSVEEMTDQLDDSAERSTRGAEGSESSPQTWRLFAGSSAR